jgi:uncharacterized protein (DUF934 family)
MPIIKNGQWAEDTWIHLSDEDALPASGAVSVSLTRFQCERAALLGRGAPLGLRLRSEERAHMIGKDAENFALIAIEFPIFRDGRGFSSARLLRERYGYRGEIRAFGHILPDQVLFLMRCGVNSIEVKPQAKLQPFSDAAHEFSVAYQNPRSGRDIAPPLRLRSHVGALAQAAE